MKCGWRVNPWREEVGLSRSYVYKLINEGKVETIRVGKARVIVVSPQEFINKYKLPTGVDNCVDK